MQKWLAGRKNGNRIFIENGVSVSKNSKDGKWEILDHLKIRI